MDTLNREIMKAILVDEKQSMYKIDEYLKKQAKDSGIESNYPTVRRRLKKMHKEGLLKTSDALRKNGNPDNRKTEVQKLTPKGLATLMIEGDLQREELLSVVRKTLQRDYADLPASFTSTINVDGIYANTFLRMRHKVNLKFFDERYFHEIFNISFAESLFDELMKHNFHRQKVNRARAKKLRKKYVTPQQVENLKKLRQQFVGERTKFNHYVERIDALLKVLETGGA